MLKYASLFWQVGGGGGAAFWFEAPKNRSPTQPPQTWVLERGMEVSAWAPRLGEFTNFSSETTVFRLVKEGGWVENVGAPGPTGT